MPRATLCLRALRTLEIGLVGLACLPALGLADGITAKGMTGGLVIPTAAVLPDQGMALGYGNFRESRFGSPANTQHNLTFGIGVLKNVEVFGRFVDYTSAPPGTFYHDPAGEARDLSANLKVKVPYLPERGPQVAFGANDLAGGNPNFKSAYVVATQRWWLLSGSVGYVRAMGNENEATFTGVFGGVEGRLDPTGLSVLAEYDGQRPHAGGRWRSPAVKYLGDLSVEATAQRGFGASLPGGKSDDGPRFTVNLHWPVGNHDRHRADARPSPAAAGILAERPAEDTTPAAISHNSAARAEDAERLTSLRRGLEDAGLERVRVGLRGTSSQRELVVEYENRRYARNEVDALGLVLGLGSEKAPAGVTRVRAITLKDGLRVYETDVDAAAFRAFLRQGPADSLRGSLTWRSGSSGASEAPHDIGWEHQTPSKNSRLRFEIRPDLNTVLGSELGAFDYSLAAEARAVAPLWAGARLISAYSVPVDRSLNMEDGRAFAYLRQPAGLKTAALGQNFRLGRYALLGAAAGRFHYHAWGAQSELAAFVPRTSDLLFLRGALYHPEPGGVEGGDKAGAVSYRHPWGPAHWTEIGWHLYSDGSGGPSLEWTRWAGDVGVTVFGRQGGQARFAGLQITVPLTPRKGMKPHDATLAGPAQHTQGLRTMLATPGEINQLRPSWVRDLVLETDLEDELLNGGRMSRAYLNAQLPRMREAFYLFAGDGNP